MAKKTERCIKGMCMQRAWFRFNASNGAYHVLGECLTTWSQHCGGYVLLLTLFVLTHADMAQPSPEPSTDASATVVSPLDTRKHQASKCSSLTLRRLRQRAGIPSTRSIDPWSSVFLVPNVYSFQPVHTAHLCATKPKI